MRITYLKYYLKEISQQFILLLGTFFLVVFSNISLANNNNDSINIELKLDSNLSLNEKINYSKQLSLLYNKTDLSQSLFYDQLSLSFYTSLNNNDAIDSLLSVIYKKQTQACDYKAVDTTLQIILKNTILKNDSSKLAEVYYNIATNYYNLSQFKLSKENFRKALDIFHKKGDKQGEAKSMKGLAVVVSTWGDYEKAIGLMQNARDLYEDIGDDNGLASIFINLGVVMQNWKKYDRAMDYYKQAYDYFKLNNDYLNEMNALMHIGDIYIQNKNYQKCVEINREAILLNKKVNNKRLYSIALSNIGEAYYEINNLDSALFYQRKSLQIKKDVGDEKRISISYLILGQIYNKLTIKDSTEKYLKKALLTSRRINFVDVELEALSSISDFYTKQKNYYLAHKYLNEYVALKESTFKDNTNKILEELDIKYESQKKETENQILKQKNEIQRLQLEREKNSRFFTIIFSAFIILITFILIFFVNARIKVSRKNYSILAFKNKEITRQKEELSQLNNDLAESRERFKGIVDNATIGIYQTNEEGKILFANKNLIKTLGYNNEEELYRINVRDSYFDRPKFLAEIKEKGVITGRDEKWIGANGKEMYVLESAWLVRNYDGSIKYIEGLVEDVTTRRKVEYALKKSQIELKLSNKALLQKNKDVENAIKEAQAAYEAKSTFLANISHEIRTPMNSIIGFTELLLKLEEDTRKKSYISAIDSSSKSLLTLINDILDLSKIQAGKLNLHYESVSLKTIINEIKQIFSIQLKNKGLNFLVEQNDDFEEYIKIDGVRLRQMLFNLVGNASKFTKKGEVKINFNSFPNKKTKNNIDLQIVITDTGPGISIKDQKQIFNAFTQGSLLSQDSSKGSGLGLAITKQLTEMMDGELKLKSKVGEGSIFTIYLPNIEVVKNHNGIKDETIKEITDNEIMQFENTTDLNNLLEINLLDDQLKSNLKELFLDDYINISNSKLISEIQLFNRKLMEFAEKNEISPLIQFSTELQMALTKFDIDNIELLLSKLKFIFNG